MNNETSITLDGVKYIFDRTKYQSTSEACEHCALREKCHDIDAETLCDALGLEHYSTYNFRQASESEQPVGDVVFDGMAQIPQDLYDHLQKLGIIPNEVRDTNVGASDYSKHVIQPWAIWQEYGLNPWDADIVKRVLRHKATDTRVMDYEKIIHICQERIRQLTTDIRANLI